MFELPRQVTYTQCAFEEYPVKKKNDGMNLLLIIKYNTRRANRWQKNSCCWLHVPCVL